MDIKTLVAAIMDGWDQNKGTFAANEQQIIGLFEAGAKKIRLNEPDGEAGVFISEAEAEGKRFICTTLKPLDV